VGSHRHSRRAKPYTPSSLSNRTSYLLTHLLAHAYSEFPYDPNKDNHTFLAWKIAVPMSMGNPKLRLGRGEAGMASKVDLAWASDENCGLPCLHARCGRFRCLDSQVHRLSQPVNPVGHHTFLSPRYLLVYKPVQRPLLPLGNRNTLELLLRTFSSQLLKPHLPQYAEPVVERWLAF
jgi:hypothetical protein